MKHIQTFESFLNESFLNESIINEASMVVGKDWDRMSDLVLKGDYNGTSVAKLIKDKNKAMARFVAGLKLSNSPLNHDNSKYNPYGYSNYSELGNLAIELGATPEEIQTLYDTTEVPSSTVDKLTKREGKKLNNRFVGVISKSVLDNGGDITYLPHNGNAITYQGKDAMSRSGIKWTIGYKAEVKLGGKNHNLIFDAITDEGNGPTYYVLADSSDEIFSPLKYKTFGKNEFIATLKDILKSVK
jgi:hypothetical protein